MENNEILLLEIVWCTFYSKIFPKILNSTGGVGAFGMYVPRQSEKCGGWGGGGVWSGLSVKMRGSGSGLECEIGGLRSWLEGRVWLALWPAVTPGRWPERGGRSKLAVGGDGTA